LSMLLMDLEAMVEEEVMDHKVKEEVTIEYVHITQKLGIQ